MILSYIKYILYILNNKNMQLFEDLNHIMKIIFKLRRDSSLCSALVDFKMWIFTLLKQKEINHLLWPVVQLSNIEPLFSFQGF